MTNYPDLASNYSDLAQFEAKWQQPRDESEMNESYLVKYIPYLFVKLQLQLKELDKIVDALKWAWSFGLFIQFLQMTKVNKLITS